MARRALAPGALAALSAGALIAGCGGGGGDDELSKAEYIQRADQICRQANDEIEAAAKDVNLGNIRQFFTDTVIPKTEQELAKIRDLPIPAGDEETLNSIYDRVEDAIQKIKDDPSALSQIRSGDLAPGVAKDSRAYGFKVCGAGT
jgi:hypothetical protein